MQNLHLLQLQRKHSGRRGKGHWVLVVLPVFVFGEQDRDGLAFALCHGHLRDGDGDVRVVGPGALRARQADILQTATVDKVGLRTIFGGAGDARLGRTFDTMVPKSGLGGLAPSRMRRFWMRPASALATYPAQRRDGALFRLTRRLMTYMTGRS
jgi:hypothetical protein